MQFEIDPVITVYCTVSYSNIYSAEYYRADGGRLSSTKPLHQTCKQQAFLNFTRPLLSFQIFLRYTIGIGQW